MWVGIRLLSPGATQCPTAEPRSAPRLSHAVPIIFKLILVLVLPGGAPGGIRILRACGTVILPRRTCPGSTSFPPAHSARPATVGNSTTGWWIP
jgi:hypothetical protein